jgi:Cu/Zn superoxide dismutase
LSAGPAKGSPSLIALPIEDAGEQLVVTPITDIKIVARPMGTHVEQIGDNQPDQYQQRVPEAAQPHTRPKRAARHPVEMLRHTRRNTGGMAGCLRMDRDWHAISRAGCYGTKHASTLYYSKARP